ncbi:MAG TPA: L-seryl-tRNA(Sec) selenium transferase [Actinomycetota bacterium]|nr:L-seryl-tRNA(Sec) selenium transferase [Actinomycetota bacterium]
MEDERRSNEVRARLRALPSVDRVLGALTPRRHAASVNAARRAIDEARAAVRSGAKAPSFDDVVRRAEAIAVEDERAALRPVLNATGVLIHTNLGRAPLGARQLDAVARVSSGYSNLEYDLAAGARGTRYAHAVRSLTQLTGAEAALVVNNNAAAVLLVLSALCRNREVIVSRGELIEIGGEFRIPDVVAQSGARIVEVGTTNRTHLADYERAISADTAAILKVHPSNYRVVGFTKSVPGRELARLARGRGVLFVHDVGSGLLSELASSLDAPADPPVDVAVAEGADLVTFSGDKLFGGPQAGAIAGRADLVAQLARHPLLRALRVDKMTLAALEATARLHLEGRSREVPLWDMAAQPVEELARRARALAAELDERLGHAGLKAEAVASRSVTGGGSMPEEDIASWAVALRHATAGAAELARALRAWDPPVVGRIEDGAVLLDLRTVPGHADGSLRDAVAASLRAQGGPVLL